MFRRPHARRAFGHAVPYKGGAPIAQDMIAGRLPIAFLDLPSALPYLKAGKIKALAVAAARRIGPLPDLVTVSESGVPGFEADAWQGLVAPAGTPDGVIEKLNAAYAKAVADAEVKKKLLDVGIEPTPSSPQDFSSYMKSETGKWGNLIREKQISVE
jgi:tripartite-type tricarboxylate transporter receptor subunit TctC